MSIGRDGSGALAAPTLQMPVIANARTRAEGLAIALVEGAAEDVSSMPTFDEVYEAHVAFVWRTLRTFGVTEAQLEDAVQDVFVVVHRRLAEWEGRAAITTWLFAIARRVASTHRRRGSADRTEALVEEPAGAADTFAAMSRADAARQVMAILDRMDEDKRIVFALVELEQLSVPQVARMLELNLNTAYSRLRLARAAFEHAARALHAEGQP
jgi:RNA polymerase sigma-70 factor, ECF subfamily